jgi:hypothetical protein
VILGQANELETPSLFLALLGFTLILAGASFAVRAWMWEWFWSHSAAGRSWRSRPRARRRRPRRPTKWQLRLQLVRRWLPAAPFAVGFALIVVAWIISKFE